MEQWHDIEWIERYLDRSLNEDEKKALEKRMANEPELKNMFVDYQQLISGIRYSHLEDRLQNLKTLEKSLPEIEEHNNQRWMNVSWRPIAAAAALVLIAVSYVLLNRTPDSQELYAQFFEPYPNVFEPTVRGTQRDDKRAEAFKAYDNADYQKASLLFNELIKEKSEPGILLLLGNSNMMTGKIDEAQNNFLTLIKDFDELDGQAKWYLGLSYLKQGQKEKARLILQELGDPNATYSKKANELLNEVK